MTLEEFKAYARSMAAKYLAAVCEMLEDKKIEPELRRKLISTGQSLTLYIEDDLESLQNSSKNSISED